MRSDPPKRSFSQRTVHERAEKDNANEDGEHEVSSHERRSVSQESAIMNHKEKDGSGTVSRERLKGEN